MLPSVVLKKMIIGNLSSDRSDLSIAQAIDFMTERVSLIEVYLGVFAWTWLKILLIYTQSQRP